jgi:hypothetical protein
MLDKNLMGYLSLAFVVLSGVPYVHSILKGRTKPHVFTHVIWGLLAAIACAAQYSGNAGPGAWAAGLSAAFSFGTAALSFSHGEREITRSDWITFMAGLSAIPLWYFTANPLVAVILATSIDALGYYPTFRKSYKKPSEEMTLAYIISNLKHIASFFAMTEYSATTLLYPGVLFMMNSALIFMLTWRRKRGHRSTR